MTPEYIHRKRMKMRRLIAIKRIVTALLNPIHLIIILWSELLIVVFDNVVRALHWLTDFTFNKAPSIRPFPNLADEEYKLNIRTRKLIAKARKRKSPVRRDRE